MRMQRQTDRPTTTAGRAHLDEVLVEKLGLRGVEEHEDHDVDDPQCGQDGGHDPHEEEEERPEGVVVGHVLVCVKERGGVVVVVRVIDRCLHASTHPPIHTYAHTPSRYPCTPSSTHTRIYAHTIQPNPN